MITRFRQFYLLFAVLLMNVSILPGEAKKTPRPHIVMFVADDLGFSDVGYHGSEIHTPNIDRIADAGARLEQFYVQPLCSPTRSSFMTGRYPIRQGLQVGVIRPWAEYGLPLNERTLPEALKETGYTTAITGKWHLGEFKPEYLPMQRGFDIQYGHYLGMIDYFTHKRGEGLDWHRNDRPLIEEGYTTHLIAREAVKILNTHDPRKPLFLYVPFNAPHSPYQAPQEYIDRYQQIKHVKRRKYAAMVDCMDEAIGRILETINKKGMAPNTLVLFFSDNGGTKVGNNRPLRDGKWSLYEGGIRVPALAMWSGHIGKGIKVNGLIHAVDLYPTLLKLAGASLKQSLPIDGMDVWPTIAQAQSSPRNEILHNIEPDPYRAAIRCGDWKLLINGTAPTQLRKKGNQRLIELFNISQDPSEKSNLAKKYPEKVKSLMQRIEFYAEQASKPKETNPTKKPKDFKAPKLWGHRAL